MILFTILAVILIILVIATILIVGAVGAGGIIIFGDVIVCIVFIALILKAIIKKKRR